MSLEAPMPLDHQAPGAHTIRRAMLRPDRYLAAALAEWPDEDLANAMRADVTTVWQLRLCGYPRADRWHAETAQPAALVEPDVGLLRTVLGALGVRP
jgi:hypothetical protein